MKRQPFLRRYVVEGFNPQAGNNISWSGIVAGVVTFIALSILFSFVSATIGLGATDLTANNPLASVGIGMLVWTIVSFILSLAAAGFVAGLTANRAGFVHGFLTWALSLVLIAFVATSTVSSVFGVVGSLLGHAGNTVTSVVGGTADVAASLSQEAFDTISNQISIDTTDLDNTVAEALKKTDIPELQPNYLQTQLDATVEDVKAAGHRVLVDGENLETATSKVVASIEERLAVIGNSLDEETLKTELAKNTDLTKSEADKAVENIKTAYTNAQKDAKRILEDVKTNIGELHAQAETAIAEGIEATNNAMNITAKYSFLLFLGLTVAAVVTSFAGYYGSRLGETAKEA